MNSATALLYVVLFLQIFITLLFLLERTLMPRMVENAIQRISHQELEKSKKELEKTALEFQAGRVGFYQKKAGVMEELYTEFEETSHRFALFAYNPDIENCQYAMDALVKALNFFSSRRLYFDGKLLLELELVEKFFNESCSLSRFYIKDISGEQHKERIHKYIGKINNQVLPGILKTIEDEFKGLMKGAVAAG